MKPSVMANATASAGTSTGNDSNDIPQSNYGINIPINHEYGSGNMQQPSQQYYNYHPQQSNQQPQHHYNEGYGSPRTQQYTNQHPSQEHQMPTHFQQFGFDPEMDVDMFPRSRLGRMHDPFAGFGTTRKRSSFHDPLHPSIDGFSHYFDDPDFDFPQFSTMGRRRAGDSMVDDHDLFNRLPSEFRQFMPDGFTHRRAAGSSTMPTNINQQQQQQPTQQQQPQPSSQSNQGYYSGTYIPTGNTPPSSAGIPQSPSKKLCDAAIQTEDPNLSQQGRSEIDGYNTIGQIQPDNLNHHGLRNTVDMGVKSAIENEMHGPRSHSAPPPEQQQQSQQHFQQQHQQQKIPINGQRNTPPPSSSSSSTNQSGQNIHTQYNTTQNTPPTAGGFQQHPQSSAYYQKYNYPRQQHGATNQQKQQTPPPSQSPGASYVRTIPIFVEGRQEPIINSHKEIPNQNESNGNISANASASANARAFTPPYQQQQQQHPHPQHQQQQQHTRNFSQQQSHQHPNRPTPFNTQQSQNQAQAQAQAQAQFQPHHHQQYNQQQSQQSSQGLPPQTPHTMDSINKIQDIQRDVLELMAQVEKFKGTRQDKEYVYLDEMLTRNLLKLDTIDTNGKESIRLARKEAIKCIQASINVLEAKAEENLKSIQGNRNDNNSATITNTSTITTSATTNNTPTSTSSTNQENFKTKKDSSVSPKNSQNDIAAKAAQNQENQGDEIIQQPNDATQIHEPIPLPPPESMQQPQSSSNDSNSESSPQKAINVNDSAQSSDTPSSPNNNESSSAESSTKTMESK